MAKTDVILVAMPWDSLMFPSIQLGILKPVLERAGIAAETRSYKLAFMQHLADVDPARFTTADYSSVTETYHGVGLGDWIFAVPPFRDNDEERDRAYFEYATRSKVTPEAIAKARWAREQVPSFLDACAAEIVGSGARVVGFTTTFSQNVASLVLARVLKQRNPSITILFGGANCDGGMGAALFASFPWVDVVVRGEGEGVLPEVVRDVLAGVPIRPQPGLCFRQGGRETMVDLPRGPTVPMDDVPRPDYDEYFERLETASFVNEVKPQVKILFESARGCWWGEKAHCTFCGLNGTTMKFRSKSPEHVFDDVMALARKYHRLHFQAVDNIIEMGYFHDLIPRLRDTGCDITLFFETKSNLKKKQLKQLAEAGIRVIQPGIESLSTPILKLMRKGVTALQNIRLLKWCAQYHVMPLWNVIYGFPGEPEAEYQRMADVVASLAHLPPPTIGQLGLDRFSPYYQKPKEFGLEVIGPAEHYRHIYPLDESGLTGLAYRFRYQYTDGRDPGAYAEPLRAAIERWKQIGPASSLTYRCGPDFMVIADVRRTMEPAHYTLEEREARIYLACDAGATLDHIRQHLAKVGFEDVSADEISELLAEFEELRLIYREGDRYLSLAIPENIDATERWGVVSDGEAQGDLLSVRLPQAKLQAQE